MNAQLRPIAAPISPPTYDNTFLGWETDWCAVNREALLDRWNSLGFLLDPTNANGYSLFCASQHDLELTRRADHRNTLRQV